MYMFADNQRISHRQMSRQMILSLIVPILLCLPGTHHVLGADGLLGILINFVVYYFVIILLIRIAPAYGELPRYVAFLYLIPLIFAGAYLLETASRLVCTYLITGVPQWLVGALILAVCSTGSHMGLEKRGRMGEVSCGLVLGSFILLYVLACFQGDSAYINSPVQGELQWWHGLDSAYAIFCAFSFLGFLPFLLSKVSKPNSSGRPVFAGVLIIGGMLGAGLVLAQAVFGWERLVRERFPILPLMAGTDLPGDVLARFDVLWIALLIYGLLFSLGSICFYGSHIMEQARFRPLRYWLLLLIYVLAVHSNERYQIEEWFGWLLTHVLAPLMVILTLYVAVWYKSRSRGGVPEK